MQWFLNGVYSVIALGGVLLLVQCIREWLRWARYPVMSEAPLTDGTIILDLKEPGRYAIVVIGAMIFNPSGQASFTVRLAGKKKPIPLWQNRLGFQFRHHRKRSFEYASFDAPQKGSYHLSITRSDQLLSSNAQNPISRITARSFVRGSATVGVRKGIRITSLIRVIALQLLGLAALLIGALLLGGVR